MGSGWQVATPRYAKCKAEVVTALSVSTPQSSSHELYGWETEKLNFQFYLILIDLNLNCHVWLTVAILDSTASLRNQCLIYRLSGSHVNL